MNTVNLTPTKFSNKGLAKLITSLKLSVDAKALEANNLLVENELAQSSINAYFDLATVDDKSTVYFNVFKQRFEIHASFETGSWSNNLKTHDFDFEDFEYSTFEME